VHVLSRFGDLTELDVKLRIRYFDENNYALPCSLPMYFGRFPRLRHLTIHLKLDPRATLETAFRPLTWWLPGLHDLEELELIDECKQKSTLPLRGADWRALLSLLLLQNRRQRTESIPALRILILPPSWTTDHLPMNDGANPFWFEELCKLTRLRINRASLRAILAGQPNGPVMPHLRILEVTAAEGSALLLFFMHMFLCSPPRSVYVHRR
jgi:hypothetical protein